MLIRIVSSLVLLLFACAPAWALSIDDFVQKRIAFTNGEQNAENADAFITLCNAVLQKDAKDKEYKSVATSARGYAYWVKKELPKALSDAKKSIELNQKTEFGYILLSLVLAEQGKEYEAAAALRKVAENAGDAEGRQLWENNANKLLAVAEKKSFDNFRIKSKELMNQTINLDVMLKLCNDAISKDAKNNSEYLSYVYAMRSNVFFHKNDFKKAKSDAVHAVNIDSESGIALIMLSDALLAEEKYSEAADTVEKALTKPKHMEDINIDNIKKMITTLRLEAQATTPRELWKSFDSNEVAADGMYKGKLIALKGRISGIVSGPMGHPIVEFNVDQYGINKVMCEFPKNVAPEIAKLKKGQSVFISGVCRGMIMKSVFLKGCKVIN